MSRKTLNILQMLPGLDEGGVEQVTLELAEYFATHGHKSIVISEGGQLVSKLEDSGTKHIQWRKIARKNPITILAYACKLRNFIIKNKIDILHLHSRVPAWVGYLACKIITKKYRPVLITHFHGFYSVHKLSAVMAKGDKIIAVSKAIQYYIINEFHTPKERIELIHNGVDIKQFNKNAVSDDRINKLKNDWNITDNHHPVLMLPGRITSLKGHDVFINSLANIFKENFLAICVGGFGSEKLQNKLTKQIKDLKLTNKIKFVGNCTDMPAAMLIADIVFSTTTSQPEAFGKIAIEAMSMGKPVIASKHGGSLETIIEEKTGWFFKPGDSADLAQQINNALDNKQSLMQAGANGEKWVKQNFTTQTMGAKVIDLYYSMLPNH